MSPPFACVMTADGDSGVDASRSPDIISILSKPLRNTALFDAIAAARDTPEQDLNPT